jgi:Complex I intermediate-associated protein 30 (CIA30)
LPFHEPLDVSNGDGVYVRCRLNSDLEAHRRIWKLTLRTDRTKGEQLYQSIITIPSTKQKGEFFTLQVPFESFRLVRGARLVPDAEPFKKTRGVCQIGLVLSKFAIAEQMTLMPNFRPGFFELLIKDIGIVYKDATAAAAPSCLTVASLTKEDAMAQRPMLIKTLMPLSRILSTEKR